MMDEFMHHSIWNFFKIIGKRLSFITPVIAVVLVGSAIIMASFLVLFKTHFEPGILYGCSVGLCTAGLFFSLRSFTEKRKVYLILGLSAGMHAMIASGVVLSDRAELNAANPFT